MDHHLVDKRLACMEAACERLRRSAVPERIATDEVQRAFAEHTLQNAIQAAIDLAVLVNPLDDLGSFVRSIRARLAELQG